MIDITTQDMMNGTYQIIATVHERDVAEMGKHIKVLIIDKIVESFIDENKDKILGLMDVSDIAKNVQIQIQEETERQITNAVRNFWK